MSDQFLLILIVAAALMYDFVNGFHDAANAIATTVATRSLPPRQAIILARTLNFVGALLHTAVAYTVGKGVVDSSAVNLPMLLAAVVGAILWGYFTWYFGLPSSSTHALIGGLIGVALFTHRFDFSILQPKGMRKVLMAMVISPTTGLICGLLVLTLFGWLARPFRYRKTAKVFKRLQIVSASFVALTHGMNDAQNAMGIIAVALLASGVIQHFHIPLWVRIASAFFMGLGTSLGGWRIIRTMGSRMTELHEPMDGCAAETAAGAVILSASLLGAPISTTQVATGAIAGAGMARRFSNVRWRVIRRILLAWVFTFPGAGLYGIVIYLLLKIFV